MTLDLTADDRRRLQHLQNVAESLRALHKLLTEEARNDYERERGPVGSPSSFLQLLMGDPYFRWLRALSGAMADLDGLLEQRPPATTEQARLVGIRFERLVCAHEGDQDLGAFGARYREYLQRCPDLVMAHAAVRLSLRPLAAC